MQKIIVVFSFLFLGNLSAQVVFNTSYHNLGEINASDKKYFDFTLTNAGKEKAIVLRIEEPYGISVKFSQKEILPDSTIIVRIKYTPKRKGKFKKDIPVWININNEPIILTLEGDAKTFNIDETLQCPDFSSKRQIETVKSELKMKVIDVNTKQPIAGAKVQIIWNGLNYKTLQTDKRGTFVQPLKWDNYYFVINAENYGTKEVDFEINKKNNYLEVELGLPTEEDSVVEEIDIVAEKVVIPPTDTISTKELPVDLFAPNNVVFCIDVSVSMKHKGRIDLLKSAMIQLLKGLRPIDKLAIVTYATSVEVVLASQYVTDKEKIIRIIKNLTAGGNTAGSKGIKKAFQVARENKIEGGNNQVIVATDGAFSLKKGDKGILNNVSTNLKKGVKISVVGVKNEKWTVKSMQAIATTGNGNYLHIKSYAQSKPLLMNEIKTNSRKK